MTSDKMQALAGMTPRQKVTAGVIVVVVLILLWQLSGMFGGSRRATPTAAKTPTAMKAGGPADSMAPSDMQAQNTPKPAEIQQAVPVSDREAALMKLQEETQLKYLEAINELQMLKVNRDIAITNKDISNAKLAKVLAEKKIVTVLTPPAPPPPSESIKNVAPVPITGVEGDVKYTVVSVSQLQYRWSAVINYKGNLYNVHVGDVLPPDGSTVSSIARDGVVLEKEGMKKKVSLVPVV